MARQQLRKPHILVAFVHVFTRSAVVLSSGRNTAQAGPCLVPACSRCCERDFSRSTESMLEETGRSAEVEACDRTQSVQASRHAWTGDNCNGGESRAYWQLSFTCSPGAQWCCPQAGIQLKRGLVSFQHVHAAARGCLTHSTKSMLEETGRSAEVEARDRTQSVRASRHA